MIKVSGIFNMKYLLLVLLSFNCLAQEVINECGQTKDQWTFDNVKCLEVRGDHVAESFFNPDNPSIIEDIGITIEELEEEWELVQ